MRMLLLHAPPTFVHCAGLLLLIKEALYYCVETNHVAQDAVYELVVR
jgi:hypothetical protein